MPNKAFMDYLNGIYPPDEDSAAPPSPYNLISAKIIADSLCEETGCRLTSMLWTYPRYIHEDVMTHRCFARNGPSSRAIPASKLIARVRESPARPRAFYKNQAGMSAKELLSPEDQERANHLWDRAVNNACDLAELLASATGTNAHKQHVNRIIQNFVNYTIIVTGTEWENYFHLRSEENAASEGQELSDLALAAYVENKPAILHPGEWHTPFLGASYGHPEGGWDLNTLLRVCTARCARLSYLTHDGEFSVEKDIALHDQLAKDGHWSPFEHCARAEAFSYPGSGPFRGWTQYRKTFGEENRQGDLRALLEKRKALNLTWLQEAANA